MTMRCKNQSVNRCRLLELPSDLLYNILYGLSADSVFSCKCVCKTFLDILEDPKFPERHLMKAFDIHDGMIIHDQRHISKFLLVHNKFELEKPDSDHNNFDFPPCQTWAKPASLSPVYSWLVYIVGACNGLLCLCYGGPRLQPFYICNPVLGECFALPPIYFLYKQGEFSGFGFCPKTKEYKVISFLSDELCVIFTLGIDHNWRKIGYAPCPRCLGAFDSSLNGNLHWITRNTTVSNLICSFNLETEKYLYTSPPAQFNQDMCEKLYDVWVGLLGGLFCFSYLFEGQYEVFVMKDYGMSGCWIKKFSINLDKVTMSLGCKIACVINLLNNGDLMLHTNADYLVCYNLQRGIRRFMLAKKVFYPGVISFIPSFISLKDIVAAAGENVEVVQRKIGRNLWSDKGFRFIHWH